MKNRNTQTDDIGSFIQSAEDYGLIEEAIRYIEKNFRRQPALNQVAAHIGLSDFHFQRLFSRWAGISPKRFLQFLTKEYAKTLLNDSDNLLNAAYDAGLSGPSRLHELFVVCEAVTPGEFRQNGKGLTISYGFHPSPFGTCMIAVTERGICGLRFMREGYGKEALASLLVSRWPSAEVIHDPQKTIPYIDKIFPAEKSPRTLEPLHLYIRGTNFQIQVWQALLRIPFGRAVSYETIADHIGMRGAARAVGNAVGDNPVPFLIPCHRVLRKTGEFGNYGEGPARKKAIIAWEAALKGVESEL